MTGDTERTARYSDPLTEHGSSVGRGAVLYDIRHPHDRPCCRRPKGRCLAHVRGVYEETTTGEVYYKVADGTWTTSQWVHADDLLALFQPAGWSVTGVKPTYLLTREHGVEDHHDMMTDGGRCSVGMERLEERIYLEYTLDDPVRGEVEIQTDVQLKEILDSDDTLVLFQGAAGWDGIEYDRDRGEFYQVNVGRNGYVSKTKRTKDEVQELIQNHIDGCYPAGPGRFVRGAEPL